MGHLQFVAVAATHESSEVRPALATTLDPAFVSALARAQDAAGFDAVLAHDSASSLDAGVLGAQVLAATATRDGFGHASSRRDGSDGCRAAVGSARRVPSRTGRRARPRRRQ